MTLGQKIKQIRQGRKITQKQLADKIGKSFSSVQKYEMDLATPPINTLEKIADALCVPFSVLLNDGSEVLEISKSGITYTFPDDDPDEDLFLLDEIKFLFRRLNESGQNKAVERVEELTEIPRYQRQPAPTTDKTPPEGNDPTQD